MAEQLAGQTTIFDALAPTDIPLMEQPKEVERLMTAVIKGSRFSGDISHLDAQIVTMQLMDALKGAGFKILRKEGDG